MSSYVVVNRFQIELVEADDSSRTFNCPEAISLEGKKIKVQLRKNVNSPAVALELSTDNELIQVTGQQFTLFFTSESTTDKAGTYVCDIKVYTNATDAITIGMGDITIKPTVTKL